MQNFHYSSLIDAPVEVVWQFHERSDILQILTPPWQPVEIVRCEGGLEVGAIKEFAIHLGLISIPWVAYHTECEQYRFFTDEQVEGLMESWRHRHEFIPQDGKTRLTDSIDYEIPGGLWVESLLQEWVNARLQDMFRYRHEVTKRECEKE